MPRLIQRNLPFKQSKNKVNVINRYGKHKHLHGMLFLHDWFHVFLRWPTTLSVFFLIVLWTVVILIFAVIYMKIDRRVPSVDCGLYEVGVPISFRAAFAFSLETCTTVGYTLPGKSESYFSCASLTLDSHKCS